MSSAVRLKFLADVQVSGVDKKSADGEVPVRLCNYTDVYYRDRITCDIGFMEATAPQAQVERFRLRCGQTLITKDSETADDIGVPAFVDCEATDLLCGYHLAQISPGASLEPRFLYWFMCADRTRSALSAEASGVTRFGLRTESVENLRIVLLDRDEQRRITAFLDAETDRIDRLVRAKVQVVESLRRRVYSQAFHLTDTGESVRLGRVLDRVQTGSTPSMGTSPGGSGIEWATPGDIGAELTVQPTARRVSPEAAEELPRFPPGSVLLVGIGATAGRIGFLDRPMSGNQQMTCLVPEPSLLDGGYLGWWMWARQHELRMLAPYTTLPILNNDYVRSIQISIPDVRRQREIASRLHAGHRAVLEASQTIADSIALLEDRRRSLVATAVTGEMELP